MKQLTVNGLVNAIALALAIWQTAQASTRKETNAARDNAGFVADNVAKQVASHDDTVQSTGALDHQHGSRVNKLVLELQLRELALEQLCDRLPPQAAGSQHVCLVKTPDLGGRVLGEGEESRQTGNALNLGLAVGLGVHSKALDAIVLLPLAKVDAASQFTDNHKVGASADLGLEGGAVDEGFGGEAAGPQVAVGLELFAQLEDAGLGSHRGGGTPFWTANGTEEDSIGRLGGSEGLVGQRRAVGIDRGLRKRTEAWLFLWVVVSGSHQRPWHREENLHHQTGAPAG